VIRGGWHLPNWTTLCQPIDKGHDSLDNHNGANDVDRVKNHPVLAEAREEAEDCKANKGHSPEVDERLYYQRLEEFEEESLWDEVDMCARAEGDG
jgi:hypothetical protein